MKEHILKVHPQFWEGIVKHTKPFEVRRDDRGFKVGDMVILKRFDPSFGFTGEHPEMRRITYILRHEDFENGVPIGYCVLGFGFSEIIQRHDPS